MGGDKLFTIYARLVGHDLTLVAQPPLASGSVQFDRVHFEFDETWDGLSKVALFWGDASDDPYASIVSGDGFATVPYEVLQEKSKIRFGVYGTAAGQTIPRMTSTLIKYQVPNGAWSDSIQNSGEPTPTLIEQFTAAAEAAIAEAQEVAEDCVSFATAQTLTDAQQEQARANIDAPATGDIDTLRTLVQTLCPSVTVGPAAVASVSDAVALAPDSLIIAVTPVQSGEGDPAPDNIRPITGWMGANVHHGESADDPDAQTYAFSFPVAAGTVYGGTLDVLTGVLTVTHAAIIVDGSTLAFYLDSNYAQYRVMTNAMKLGIQGTRAISNWLPSTVLRVNANTGFLYGYVSDYATIGIDSAEALNAKCAETPLVVVYQLASPVTYQLTPAQVTMLTGSNTIWADCGNTTLTYRANPYDRLLSRIEALEEDSLGKPSVNMGWMRPIANYFDTGSSSGLSVAWVDASDDAPVRPTPLSSAQAQPDTTDAPTEGDDA